jgi:hypothetical protein
MLSINAGDTRKKNLFMVTGLGYLLSVNQYPVIYMGDIIFRPSQIAHYGIVTVSLIALFAYVINILHVEYLPLITKLEKIIYQNPT